MRAAFTYHKERPFIITRYLEDPHAAAITAQAMYAYDPGYCAKVDISIVLYGKCIYNFRNKNSELHNTLFKRSLAI